MATDGEWLEEVMKGYASDKTIQSLSNVSGEPAVAVGNNFASNINRIRFNGISGTGRITDMSVIVKKRPTSEGQLRFLEAHNFFNTEIKLYKELLPKIESVLKEFDVSPLWPTLIGLKDNILIFSDLKRKNYKLPCKESRLDLEHSVLGMRTIAVFHSASVVLRERGELDVTGLGKTYLGKGTKEMTKIIKGAMLTAAIIVIDNWGPQWRDIGQRMLKKSETWKEELEKLLEIDDNRLNVLNHGDIWISNLMFKYSRCLDVPIDLRFVDFQLSHYNSYAYDLIYFIYTSIPPELRRQKYKYLLNVYSDKLRESLEFYGLGNLAPSPEVVEEEMKRLSLYSFIVVVCILPLVIRTIKNTEDIFDRIMNDNEDNPMKNQERYLDIFKTEVEEDFLQWANEGLF